MGKKEINAIIGVWYKGNKTFYVKRSETMVNYPNVWSLLSIQFDANELTDPLSIDAVRPYIDRMSEERLGGVSINVTEYIDSGLCTKNPIDSNVHLYLYAIEIEETPKLNPDYYGDMGWFTAEEYLEQRGDGLCGSCMRLWSDYCVKHGMSEIRFAPEFNDH